MPSLRHLLVFVSLALTSLQLSSASPIDARAGAATAAATTKTTTTTSSTATPYPTPSLPSSGEASSSSASGLPQPLSNLTLKHVTIGSGVQNYSCAPGQAKPLPLGALATLYDATVLAYTSPSTLNTAPALAIQQSLTSVLIAGAPLSLPALAAFPIIGSHYFTADGTPAFDLFTHREILFAKKLAAVPAPKGSPRGANGEGAVDWLALTAVTDSAKGVSVGLGEVYRVQTAGGNPPESCDGVSAAAVLSVQYSAQYWFYG